MREPIPDVIAHLREALATPVGRHLYAVLGERRMLDAFASQLQQATLPDGRHFPPPLDVNRGILRGIPDDEFQTLVRDEAKWPEPVRQHVRQSFETLFRRELLANGVVVLANLEILFAYGIDLSNLRTLSTDQHRTILLLPGHRADDHVVIFPEASDARTLPSNLIATNHVWEVGMTGGDEGRREERGRG